jgi:hypothetical protein
MLSEIALWALQALILEALDFKCSVSVIDHLIPIAVANIHPITLILSCYSMHISPSLTTYLMVS